MQVLNSIRASIAVLVATTAGCAPLPQGCIPVDKEHAAIYRPGHYCLTESLHVRFEMADRWAESYLIGIHSGNVILDLGGHYLTQNEKNNCIRISRISGSPQKITNVVIRNGTLRSCGVGVYQSPQDYPAVDETPNHDKNTYRFPTDNIVLENINTPPTPDRTNVRRHESLKASHGRLMRAAIHLAVKHTMQEIDKLWDAAAGKTLQEAFGMDKNALQSAGIDYQNLWSKDQRP